MTNPKTRIELFFVLALLIFVVVPFLFWRGTWFGTELTEAQMRQYLAERDKPRHVQHALARIEKKISAADPSARVWYPDVLRLSAHPSAEVRITVAWVMGQDNTYAPFHAALLPLLQDPDLMVRRNAALSLVRFGDAAGKGEILSMLRPTVVNSAAGGIVELRVSLHEACAHGAPLGKVVNGKTVVDLTAPISGRVEAIAAHEGDRIAVGQPILTLRSDDGQIWEALRALYLIGRREDLSEIATFTRTPYPEQIRRQAAEATDAIGKRSR